MADETTTPSEDSKAAPAKGKPPLKLIIIAAAVVAAGAAGGFVLTRMGSPPAAHAAGTTSHPAKEEQIVDPAEAYQYLDMEPVIASLDEPRLGRFVRAAITLAVTNDNKKAAGEAMEKKKPELKHKLTVILSGCGLEDVRGSKNLTRLQREILDSFNDALNPGRPLIHHVLFKDFLVQ